MSNVRTAGISIYIQEELSDARLRCDELKHMIVRAMDLVRGSGQRDHIYGIAGDIITAIPETLLKLERAIEATTMAVNELSSTELRQNLRPEKIDELDRVLEELKVYIPKRI